MKTWQEVYAKTQKPVRKMQMLSGMNGLACRGETPGPGGKGAGAHLQENAEMLKRAHYHGYNQ